MAKKCNRMKYQGFLVCRHAGAARPGIHPTGSGRSAIYEKFRWDAFLAGMHAPAPGKMAAPDRPGP